MDTVELTKNWPYAWWEGRWSPVSVPNAFVQTSNCRSCCLKINWDENPDWCCWLLIADDNPDQDDADGVCLELGSGGVRRGRGCAAYKWAWNSSSILRRGLTSLHLTVALIIFEVTREWWSKVHHVEMTNCKIDQVAKESWWKEQFCRFTPRHSKLWLKFHPR